MSTLDLNDVAARLGAYLLGITPEQVRTDERRWAAFHWDDGFVEDWFREVDWVRGQLPDGAWNDNHQADLWFWSRNDFDYARSIVDWEGFLPGETTDLALRDLFVDGSVYGKQLGQLVEQERVSLDAIELPMVLGRVAARSESLLDTLRALFMLDGFPDDCMGLHEFAEVDEEHAGFVASIEPRALRDHISLFFQESQAVRCGGAAPDGIAEDSVHLRMFGIDAFRRHFAWWSGEGQAHFHLVEVLDDTIPPVPPFAGRTYRLRSVPEPGPLGTPFADADERAAFLTQPLLDLLRTSDLASVQSVGEELADRNVEAVFAGLSLVEGALRNYLEVERIARFREHRLALAVLEARAPFLAEEERCDDLFLRGESLLALGLPAEAQEVAADLVDRLQAGASSEHPVADALLLAARSAEAAGDAAAAVDYGRTAQVEASGRADVQAVLGAALVALGEEDEGFELLGKAMAAGHEPWPRPEIEAHPRYLELAREHGAPVTEGVATG